MLKKRKTANVIITILLIALSCMFIAPILIVLMNSFKGKLFISDQPFTFPTFAKQDLGEAGIQPKTFVGFKNYINGVEKIHFFDALGRSVFITVFAVILIVLFTSMTAWFITRVKNHYTSTLYYLFVFSMVIPFQMVMYAMTKVADVLHLSNPVGILVLYLGFGAGMSVFMFSGFVKGVPIDIEEAATIDGCNPLQCFFKIVFPVMKPTAVTVAILNTMWVWNDYLMPYLVMGKDYPTIPIAIQYLQGGYGSIDMGAMMAMLILAVIPIIIFYALCQKYIIEGVVAGAVKG
ncbi:MULTISPECIES: carbohydrate ABC transporter permease [Caproicibacterium]|jgi:raffinose/stachyose/melibiose transport system permease protein|nr:carbohydrate ABC transporter permease [Caproicibacterium lactatifermentans]ARP50783.1 sugar ABC transporter permease [Ruminococcaceae bacterium CPB6]MDD4808050.1 carbohydrate ABC transporter permease [Oscillospiraceae bacterium]QKN23486.1 ABC transporter permease subunit [Caproicibacterium lactatifermentans]